MLQLRGKWNYPFGTFKPFLYMTTTQQIVDPLKQLYSVYLHTVENIQNDKDIAF
jgi:hypothetical protein